MPRPSSPLDAKASTRSPYALDRSQQNSCVVGSLKYAGPRRPKSSTQHMRFVLSDNDVFYQVSPGQCFTHTDRPFIHDVNPPAACAADETGHSRSREFSPSTLVDGGARRDRTDDLMLAKHALYQLSYGPNLHQELRRAGLDRSAAGQGSGRPGQTRTADLTLIRRTL